MNDIVTKAAKLDQSRRIAKTKARLLQGLLNQRGGAKGVPKHPQIEEKVEELRDTPCCTASPNTRTTSRKR